MPNTDNVPRIFVKPALKPLKNRYYISVMNYKGIQLQHTLIITRID